MTHDPLPGSAATMRPITDDFYLDPNGEWVYRWSDERLVLPVSIGPTTATATRERAMPADTPPTSAARTVDEIVTPDPLGNDGPKLPATAQEVGVHRSSRRPRRQETAA